MGEETLFSWIHLSDIHVGHGDTSHRWDQKLVLREIARDVVAARAEGLGIPAPDAILVTGDVAFSGNGVVRAPNTESLEYAEAKAWLLEVAGKVGLEAKQVFVVPGNHDVDRGKDWDRDTARLVKSLQRGDESLDNTLADPGDRKRLATRMQAFLAFAADFAPWCLGPARPPEERLYWTHRHTARGGLTVRLAGLNTALLSTGDSDFGHLRLGLEQLVRAFNEPPIADVGELVIALSHHPLRSWLADAGEAEAVVRRHAHLHLSGHVHESESEQSRTGGAGHGFLRVVAGASHADRAEAGATPAGHGYSWAAIVADGRGALELRIWPRRWSDENRDFRQDVNKVRRGKSYAFHPLEVTLAPVASTPPDLRFHAQFQAIHGGAARAPEGLIPGSQRFWLVEPLPNGPLPDGPLPTFISYAPADKAALGRLEVHIKPLKREGLIDTWSATEVGGGAEAKATAARRLTEARVVLLLVSPDFLASDECHDVEMMTALARHDRREATVIPILLRDADFASAPFAKLQFLPWFRLGEEKPRPVYGGDDEPETAFAEVAQAIRREIERLRGTAPKKP